MPKMPKMSPPPFDAKDPHEMIDWLRREGYEVAVRNMRSEPGRISVELVGYQTYPPRVEYTSSSGSSNYTITAPSYLSDEMRREAGMLFRPQQGAKPVKAVEPEEETFGLAQPWEDVEEWFNC